MKTMVSAAAALLLAITPGAALAQSGASLADSMQRVSNLVAGQGPVTFQGSVHDPAANSSWTYNRTVAVTNFRPDLAACTLYFHFEELTPGHDNVEKDGWVPFKDVRTVTVQTLEQELAVLDANTGHPQWQVSIQPEVYVVTATRPDGVTNDFDFYSQSTAISVAAALRRAAQLCGGG